MPAGATGGPPQRIGTPMTTTTDTALLDRPTGPTPGDPATGGTVTATTELVPRGAFDLARSIGFGFGQREARAGDVLRLGFVVEATGTPVARAVRQDAAGTLGLEVTAAGPAVDADAVARQVARVLSVDIDATGWDDLGRDAGPASLLGRLRAAQPGLRPPLFHSAYEAAAWSVLSARRPHQPMAALRERLSRAHGTVLAVAGEEVAVFPTPTRLLAVESFPSLPQIKLDRLHGVARAALAGELDTAALRALDPAEAVTRLRRLDGIGPFYAELVVVRALGHTDVVPTVEPTVLELAGRLTGAPGPLTAAAYAELAEGWRPWRTWASVALRAAGPSLLDPATAAGTRPEPAIADTGAGHR